jgi:hypothetical protein
MPKSLPGGRKRRPVKPAAARGNARVRKHRAKLRAAGLKPIQIWVPDITRPGFAEECRRQSLLVRDHPQEKEMLTEIEATTDFESWR